MIFDLCAEYKAKLKARSRATAGLKYAFIFAFSPSSPGHGRLLAYYLVREQNEANGAM